MFKRFSQEIEDVMVEARDHAARLSDRHIGTEHVLLGLLTAPTAVQVLLQDLGLTVEHVESERVGSDRDALAALGIDLGQVEAATDSAFGVGSLEQARRNRDRTWRWRRRSRHRRRTAPSGMGDCIPFSPRCKNALELSLGEALQLKHDIIGPEHLALGLLNEGEGLACRILIRNGITLEALRTSLQEISRRAA